MTEPPLIAQLRDPHIGASWAGGDPLAGLAAAVETVRRLRPAAPSTYATARLDFGLGELRFGAEPIGLAVHAFANGELCSHVESIT
jgi:hypothetical protein